MDARQVAADDAEADAAGRAANVQLRGRDRYNQLFDDFDENRAPRDARVNVLRIPGQDGRAVRLRAQVDREFTLYNAFDALPRVVQDQHGVITLNSPLLWWQTRHLTLPILAELARRVLCTPATSAPSERLFSHAGLTIANDRASLLPENAANLIYLHDAWPIADDYLAKRRRL